MDTTAPPVTARVSAGTGVIELDRPSALNALDLTMIELITEALESWRGDPAVRSVVIRSASPKAFCAGGDIRAMRDAGLRGDDAAVLGYFSAEYALNALIAGYPKPYTALIDGYAMGGGLGVSVHGSARVVTERAVLAMPETAIGFFPDIGASHFLPRLPGAVGWYLGLTGVRIGGAAAVECGLATHYVPAADLPALEAALLAGGAPAPTLDRFAAAAPRSGLAGHRAAVERCFTAADLGALRDRLAAEDTDRAWADETLAALAAASPMSLALTFDLLRDGAGSGLEECLARELALARRVAHAPDFHEGVRAALIDKDRAPVWSPYPLPAM
ncbi:enoyl-CoA hydratase [Streptomyces sp. DvalAA-14]|uniref:enoyl-CoA hydratase/isomerase family protein n=1 Tax=unclassified Streptomyces TaxID=2593676 RepID=UPI00081B7495|nr:MULTISPECIES: enoyl-CoA hydratase/isomerase family protein [unclassified Streptomyces]MYS19658.1 enoyl-CoA hydratase/isomerase family protein [Streptomyces sp. SID4948]SCD49890.1 enoyl-CoA hydratase [Streptomyces sp. DvalAA-14]